MSGQRPRFSSLLTSLGKLLSKSKNAAPHKDAPEAPTSLGLEDQSVKEDIPPKLLHLLVQWLDQSKNPAVAEQAAKVLRDLAAIKDLTTKQQIAYFPHLLDGLARSLSINENPALQENATSALANLLACGDDSIKAEIDKIPRLTDDLGKLVCQVHNSVLTEQAARTVHMLIIAAKSPVKNKFASFPNLLAKVERLLFMGENSTLHSNATGPPTNVGLRNHLVEEESFNLPGMLQYLVQALDQGRNFVLAEQAATIIRMLAATKNPAVKLFLASFPNLIESLAGSLLEDENPGLQKNALLALTNLGCGNQSIEEKFFRSPGLLEDLVKSVNKDQGFELGEHATRAIGILAATEDSTMKEKIAAFPDLLESLARLLYKGKVPILQVNATLALANFGCGSSVNKERIFSLPGLLDNLVMSVDQSQNTRLAEQAARAIGVLAAIEDSKIKSEIAGFQNLLESLVRSLLKDDDPALQIQNSRLAEQAARAIGTLAASENSKTKSEIASFPNLLEILVRSVLKVENPALQENAASALANLGCGNQSIKKKIFNVPGLLGNLVKSVDQGQNSGLAEEAVRVVGVLATTKDAIMRSQIVCFPSLLESLVWSLLKSQNSTLQENAAFALTSLVCIDHSSHGKKFNAFELLDNLVKSMEQSQNTGLAEQAARVVGIMAATENSMLRIEIVCSTNVLESLVGSLLKDENPLLQENAALALANFGCGNQEIKERMVFFPGLLDNLVRSLDQLQNSGLAEQATRVVGILATTKHSTSKKKVACFPNLVESLARLFLKGTSPALQEIVASTLANVGCASQSVNERVFNVPGLLDKLVKAMDQVHNFRLAEQAARTVRMLVTTTDIRIQGEIACSQSLLETLVVSLSKCENPALQENAAGALASLGSRDQSIKGKIFNVPGLLNNLVKAMDQGHNFGLAEQAARTIHMLATTTDIRIQGEISSFHSLLETLVVSLSKCENPALQENAAGALASLGSRDQSIKGKIFNVPGLLENLVKAVDQGHNFRLAEQAARSVYMLATTTDVRIQGEIACFHSLLETLVVSLSKCENPALQENAAGALASLGSRDQSIKEKIFNVPGLLDNLVKAVDQGHNFGLAEQAARTVSMLATITDPTIKGEIACFHSLLESLVVSLSKSESPALQENAARALASLGSADQSIKEKIFNVPALLDNLVKSMNQDYNSELAEQATSVVTILTTTKNATMKNQIVGFPCLIESLSRALSRGEKPTVQGSAALALASLGRGNESIKKKILCLPGIPDHLVKLMNQDQNCGLKEQTEEAIHLLAASEDSTMKGKITHLHKLPKSLAGSADKGENPALQQKQTCISTGHEGPPSHRFNPLVTCFGHHSHLTNCHHRHEDLHCHQPERFYCHHFAQLHCHHPRRFHFHCHHPECFHCYHPERLRCYHPVQLHYHQDKCSPFDYLSYHLVNYTWKVHLPQFRDPYVYHFRHAWKQLSYQRCQH